ncbi:MAG: ABC transporter permease [Clostridiales bacterium]|nr:ABC transporter permease [Clostridiales bacterium]
MKKDKQKSVLAKEPLFRLSRRAQMVWYKAWLIRAVALCIALILSALLIYAITKMNPFKVYGTMLKGAFGDSLFVKRAGHLSLNRTAWTTLRDVMTLLCISVGLAPAFKMRFWNCGAEGQVLVGGIATAGIMIYFGGTLPTPLLFACMAGASLLAGAVWGLIPALFKAKWNTNETLFTLMMNYIAIQLTSYFVAMWENPYGSNTVGVINRDTKIGWLPNFFSSGANNDFMWNVIIVSALTIAMFIYLKKSKQGYEIAVVGESENTAKYAGINVKKVIIRTMLLSGAVCGLAGFIAVSGSSHTISTATAGGRGFTAIIVAWLSKFNTFVMAFASLLIVFLETGANEIASQYNFNTYASKMVEGIILFFIIGCEFFIQYKVHLRVKRDTKEVAD